MVYQQDTYMNLSSPSSSLLQGAPGEVSTYLGVVYVHMTSEFMECFIWTREISPPFLTITLRTKNSINQTAILLSFLLHAYAN